MTKLSTLKRKMLADPKARKEYERLGPEFEISSELRRRCSWRLRCRYRIGL